MMTVIWFFLNASNTQLQKNTTSFILVIILSVLQIRAKYSRICHRSKHCTGTRFFSDRESSVLKIFSLSAFLIAQRNKRERESINFWGTQRHLSFTYCRNLSPANKRFFVFGVPENQLSFARSKGHSGFPKSHVVSKFRRTKIISVFSSTHSFALLSIMCKCFQQFQYEKIWNRYNAKTIFCLVEIFGQKFETFFWKKYLKMKKWKK